MLLWSNWEEFQITALDILVMFLFFAQCAEKVGFINFFSALGTGAKYLLFFYFFAYKDLMNPFMEITEQSTRD